LQAIASFAIERDGGGDRGIVLSPLVVDDGQQTFLP